MMPDELPVLETLCGECEGQGGDWSEGGYGGDWRRCWHCNGAGHVPTPFGQRVLALMRHNFRPMLGDARADPRGAP
jgi:hypothetical protein